MKRLIRPGIALLLIISLHACEANFLNITPNGALDAEVMATETGIDNLLIGVYSMLDGTSANGFGWEAAASNWVFGSMRAMIANKGSDAGDQSDINPLQTYNETATNLFLNVKWRSLYESISRANVALQVVSQAEESGNITEDQAASFRQQLRTLRGHFHLEAWKMWEQIPYLDEETNPRTVTNTEDVRDRILEDLKAGTELPLDMGQIGRFNKTVSQVILAKGLMQMKGEYAQARTLLEEVVASGTKPDGSPIGLAATFGDIFDAENRNGIEAVYTVQYSVNDGSAGWNGGWGEVLNFPYKSGESPGGCCGFFQPNQEFVNSFRTDVNGLPLLDFSYNNDPVLNDQSIAADDPSYVEDPGNLDPRLDWTVGRRGIPYLDWGEHTGQDWIRDQSYAGPFSPKKQVYRQSQEGTLTEVGNWTSGWTANGYRMIRYADVLLLLAECQIQTGELEAARTNINQVRNRAANPDGFVMEEDGHTPAANYQISGYPSVFASQQEAMNALMMERKLELGMEGHRYFDLRRWEVAVQEVQRILTYEKTQRVGMYFDAEFSADNVLYPVPQRQIDLSHGNLVQN